PPDLYPFLARNFLHKTFLGRMIFSCLVDADYLNTDAFYNQVEGHSTPHNQAFPSLADLRRELNHYLSRFTADSPENQLRGEILAGVRERANLQPGLFSLTVPTGGGKRSEERRVGKEGRPVWEPDT